MEFEMPSYIPGVAAFHSSNVFIFSPLHSERACSKKHIGGAHNCGTSMWVLLANTKHASHARTHGGGGRKSFSVAPAFRFALICLGADAYGIRSCTRTALLNFISRDHLHQPAAHSPIPSVHALNTYTMEKNRQTTNNLKARVPFAPGQLISPLK